MVKGFRMELQLSKEIENLDGIVLGAMELWDGDRTYEMFFDDVKCERKGNRVAISASSPSDLCPDYKKVSNSISVNSVFVDFVLSDSEGSLLPVTSIVDMVFFNENNNRMGLCKKAYDSVADFVVPK